MSRRAQGYRSRFGPYLLGSYRWFLNEEVDGGLHLDYREKRGVGGGPDLNLHMGRWGETSLKYYYLRDQDPATEANGLSIPENRQRVYFGWWDPDGHHEIPRKVQYRKPAWDI